MNLPTFIRLENSLSEAMKYCNSPQMTEYMFSGVQLLPNNIYSYTQRTYSSTGIEIEDYIVKVKDLCGNTLDVITDYFEVVRNFQDPNTGLPQIEWSINNVPYDFGYNLIYLEIQSGANGYVYSSPFMITESRGEFVSDWYYRNDGVNGTLMGIGLQLYFRQPKSAQEVTNYTPISTGVPYNATSKRILFERWNTSVIDIYLLEETKSLFDCKEIYSKPSNFDGLPLATGLYEAIDTPDLSADENFAEVEVLLIRDKSKPFDPNALPIIPPTPPPTAPYITITNVTRSGSFLVNVYFTFGNFSPTYLTIESSLDGVTWSAPNTGGITSPRTQGTPLNNYTNTYYFRIIHQGTGTISNIFQMPASLISVTSITSLGGRQYSVLYNTEGFDIQPGTFLEFQSSNDGDNWNKTITTYDNNNPKVVEVIESIPSMDRLRIKYNNIISNTYMLP
jgi:hypothetical protein